MLVFENIACNGAAIRGISKLFRRSTRSAGAFYFNDKFEPGESRFEKVLIANRGEIACRVITTCQRLGIKTVAVYSAADAESLFVHMADEAIFIGSPPSAHSYLNVDAILDAVRTTGAEAVHPGYGFLSENYIFAKKVTDLGVAFVGPDPEAIRLMGNKVESKIIAAKVGVNCIPGSDKEVRDPAEALEVAEVLGYPVIVKALAGGGGKGMRIARDDAELFEALRLSREEARASFGDDRILLERYLVASRHIEVQVLCDKHGNALHLHERDCSIQRRNQKVVEEAPSSLFTSSANLRRRICDQAIALVRAVGYDSAGTVEFLFDGRSQNFYFLEMNTRLQVEHPVTECITGVDIVHQMLRVAKGHRLLYRQEDISTRGWAMECRVCAEDPRKAFGLPSVGQLTSYREPSHIRGVRCDSSVVEGSEISVFYDALICKLVAYGGNRKAVLSIMAKALDSFIIRGVTTNIPLLRDIISETGFVSGEFATDHLARIYPEGFRGAKLHETEVYQLIALASVINVKNVIRNQANVSEVVNSPFRLVVSVVDGTIVVKAQVIQKDDFFKVMLEPFSSKKSLVRVIRVMNNFNLADGIVEQNFNEQETIIFQLRERNHVGDVCLQYRGSILWLRIRPEKTAALESAFITPHKRENKPTMPISALRAPLPGLVTSISVNAGQVVEAGQELCILEAMKMRNCLNATHCGIVKAVNVRQGQTVAEGEVILELE
ncbi:propionyl coenzyme A carboxylase alpha chain [Echinococcus multilocularis]|uniref:propionyl-CoA carboxylase n=1 Tax=Echinococcus multilocularis TaxID=6211 RepID=A0A068Y029_ECHMU|nr:propionyl coenzyme A carboxylase alpha chain [Echinococcus multilocularis]